MCINESNMEEREMLQLPKGKLMTHLAGCILLSYVHMTGLLVSRSKNHTSLLTINGLIICNSWLIQNIPERNKEAEVPFGAAECL